MRRGPNWRVRCVSGRRSSPAKATSWRCCGARGTRLRRRGRRFVPSRFRPPSPPELAHWRAFAAETLVLDVPTDRLHAAGGRLYLLPARRPDTGGLHLVRYGLLLGELRPGYFRPSHELALALDATDAQHNINWSPHDGRLAGYFAGEDVVDPGPNGRLLVTVDGFGLGWAKRVDGRLKNHYPRPLRRRLGGEPG